MTLSVIGRAEWRRRAELTSLLQACRSRLVRPGPDVSGAGLRQEDAADLAGLSVRRYAAFERGEIARPQPQTVAAVASALRMTAAEGSTLRVLATGHDALRSRAPVVRGAPHVLSPVFRELLSRQDPNPALITDETWTIVARNEAMAAWADQWLDLAGWCQRNLVLYLFSDVGEKLLYDVHTARRTILAGWRYQYARNLHSEKFTALIDQLLARNPVARELWALHEVAMPPRENRLRIRHAAHGLIEAEHAALQMSAQACMHVVIFPQGLLAEPWGRSKVNSAR